MHSSRGASDSGSRKGKGRPPDHSCRPRLLGFGFVSRRESWCLALFSITQGRTHGPWQCHRCRARITGEAVEAAGDGGLSRPEAYPAKWLLLRHVAQRTTSHIPVLVFAGTRHRVSSMSPPSGERCLTTVSVVVVRLEALQDKGRSPPE